MRRLEGKPAFLLLCLGQSLSQLGSGLSAFAIALWVYERSGSVTQLALFYLSGAVPAVAILPWAGQLVDRFDRRRIMLGGDLLAGALSALLLALFLTETIEVWQLLAIVAVATALTTLQGLAFSASISSLVPADFLPRANGLEQVGRSVALLIAPALAGLVLGIVGVPGVLTMDLATLGLAVVTYSFVRIPRPEPMRGEDGDASRVGLSDLLFGFRFIAARRGLLLILLLFAAVNLAMGMVQTLFTPLVLGFASEAVLGTILTVVGAGILVGGLTVSVTGGPRNRASGIVALVALQGVALILGGLWANAWAVAAAGFVFMACGPFLASIGATIWQRKTPAAVQGRVFAVRQLVATAATPVAYAVAGPLADRVFEPLLAVGGPLAASVGAWIGAGKGRGIALQMMALGVFLLVAAGLAWQQRALRRVESEVPDAIEDVSGDTI